jgi:hypothetical protein
MLSQTLPDSGTGFMIGLLSLLKEGALAATHAPHKIPLLTASILGSLPMSLLYSKAGQELMTSLMTSPEKIGRIPPFGAVPGRDQNQ